MPARCMPAVSLLATFLDSYTHLWQLAAFASLPALATFRPCGVHERSPTTQGSQMRACAWRLVQQTLVSSSRGASCRHHSGKQPLPTRSCCLVRMASSTTDHLNNRPGIVESGGEINGLGFKHYRAPVGLQPCSAVRTKERSFDLSSPRS